MSKREIGLKRMHEILGASAPDILKSFDKISPDFAHYIAEFVYGDLYAREGITDKTRELAVVACMLGSGNTGFPLRAHLNAMLNVGWSKQEILEIIIFLAAGIGYPTAVEAIKIADEVFTARETVT